MNGNKELSRDELIKTLDKISGQYDETFTALAGRNFMSRYDIDEKILEAYRRLQCLELTDERCDECVEDYCEGEGIEPEILEQISVNVCF